jgi:hypothetical protein
MERARPTLRCLRADLKLPLPPVDQPLDEIDHPLAEPVETAASCRLPAILQLCPPLRPHWGPFGPYTSARSTGTSPWTHHLSSYVGGGGRSGRSTGVRGSVLAGLGRPPRRRRRHRLLFRPRQLAKVVHELCLQSLLTGREHAASVGGAVIGIQIRADHGHETYVAVRVVGSVPPAPRGGGARPRTGVRSRWLVSGAFSASATARPCRTGVVERHGSRPGGEDS